MTRVTRTKPTTALLVATLASCASFAFEPPTESLAARAGQADAVVQAVVRDVQYRLSQATPEQPPIPFTFVTFAVERVFRGAVAPGDLTLRFQGGLFPDGRFLDDPTAPLFDVGERSILLVAGNGELDVPLVGWRYGRLRVVEGAVYDDFGSPLQPLSPGRVSFGRTQRLDEVVEHRMHPVGRAFNPRLAEVPGFGLGDRDGSGLGPVALPASPAPVAGATLDQVASWLRALPSAPNAAPARAVVSSDPNQPFVGRSLTPMALSTAR